MEMNRVGDVRMAWVMVRDVVHFVDGTCMLVVEG